MTPASLLAGARPEQEVQKLHPLIEQEADGTLHFESYDLQSPLLEEGARFVLRSWWLPTAWEAVTDRNAAWRLEMFDEDEPEPCLFTWEEIRLGDQAYRSSEGDWVSKAGYDRFIRDDVLRLRALSR